MPRKLSKSRNVYAPASSSSSSSSHSTTNLLTPYPQNDGLPPFLTDGLPLPSLVVLDLDYTLWPFYSDCHPWPPLRALSGSVLSDRNGENFSFYKHVPIILHLLQVAGVKLAVASKSPVGDLCREMLKLLRIPGGLPTSVEGFRRSPATKGAAGAADGKGDGEEEEDSSGKKTKTKGSGSGSGSGGGLTNEKGRKTIELFDGGLEIYEGTKLRHFEVIQKRTGIPYEEMLFFDDERPNLEVERVGVTMQLIKDGLDWEELEKGIQKWRANRGIA
ncbi:acid phosphatase-domain-containing protein [Neurospora hispaniola]|uniref:Acid phosphatase-domain-containing protein n=1 Tax=Neurospora hispaniola TaxID=588809 RepID=A0AAJ0HZY9_9PEZI|nr:acid phosphatase-domain-containing protein [Neurospora hispaniola]